MRGMEEKTDMEPLAADLWSNVFAHLSDEQRVTLLYELSKYFCRHCGGADDTGEICMKDD